MLEFPSKKKFLCVFNLSNPCTLVMGLLTRVWSLSDAISEALGQLGRDEPASGIALVLLVAFAPILGSVAIALQCTSSELRGYGPVIAPIPAVRLRDAAHPS
jgi:hypothetical protein